MARLLTALAIALAAGSLAACGDSSGETSTSTSTSTSTTTATSTSSTATTAPRPSRVASRSALAGIVVQLDDQLRRLVVDAEPCLASDSAGCTGAALEAYERIGVLVDGLSLLEDVVTEGGTLYSGELPPELIGRYDATMNARTAVSDAATRARDVCLPDFPPDCPDANQALRDSLIELYKLFNEWRDDL